MTGCLHSHEQEGMAAFPQMLLTCFIQCLAAWRPGLPGGHVPKEVGRYACCTRYRVELVVTGPFFGALWPQKVFPSAQGKIRCRGPRLVWLDDSTAAILSAFVLQRSGSGLAATRNCMF